MLEGQEIEANRPANLTNREAEKDAQKNEIILLLISLIHLSTVLRQPDKSHCINQDGQEFLLCSYRDTILNRKSQIQGG